MAGQILFLGAVAWAKDDVSISIVHEEFGQRIEPAGH